MADIKHRMGTGLEIARGQLDVDSLRTLATKDPVAFAGRCAELIEKGEMKLSQVRNLRTLFNSLVDISVPTQMEYAGATRAITTGAFPLLMGGMVVAAFNEAYAAVPTIGQELVTDMEDNKKVTLIAGVHPEDTKIDRVDEGKEFPEIGVGEEKYEIRHKRNGRRLSLTAEAIEENDVAGFVARVNTLAYIAASMVERQTLERVQDVDGSGVSPAEPYVLRINGTPTTLYSASANSPGTRAPSGTRIQNNALVDDTDLDAARVRLASMKDSLGNRIQTINSRTKLVVPDALLNLALQITGSEMIPGSVNELNNWGPKGRWRPQVVSSPWLDDYSTTTWYYGDFQTQFARKWKLMMEYVTMSGTTEDFLRSRVAFQARIAWDVEIGARDYCYVVQSLSATTAPARS